MHSHIRSVAVAAITIVVGAASLSACAPQRTPPTASPSVSSTAGTPSASATPTATAAASGEPFTIDCTELVGDQTIYDWGSGNWALDPNATVAANSAAAEVVAHAGTACGWINLSSGETLTVAAATPGSHDLAAAKTGAAAGASISGLGTDAYFSSSNGVGTVQAFTGTHWLVASSTWFYEAGDAQPIVADALAALN